HGAVPGKPHHCQTDPAQPAADGCRAADHRGAAGAAVQPLPADQRIFHHTVQRNHVQNLGRRAAMKKIILCLLVLALLPGSLTARATQAQPSAPEGYTLVDFNDALALFADFESGNIILSDRAAGYLWRSNPEGEDSKARGVHRQTLLSQITVNYT